MGSNKIAQIAKTVNSTADHDLKSAVIKYLKKSSVDIHARKVLIGILRSGRSVEVGIEVYPGFEISKPILDIMFERKYYEAALLALEVIQDGAGDRKEYRRGMIKKMQDFGFEFSEVDLKNTRIHSAIDNIVLLAGYCFIKTRKSEKIDELTKWKYYTRLKRIPELEMYDMETLEVLASRNINRVESLYNESVDII